MKFNRLVSPQDHKGVKNNQLTLPISPIRNYKILVIKLLRQNTTDINKKEKECTKSI